jgi:hypothetical protein
VFVSPVLPTAYDMHLLSCLGMIWIKYGDFEMAFMCIMLMGRLSITSPPSQSAVTDYRYYDPLRLPNALLVVVRFSLSSHDTLFCPLLCVSIVANGLIGKQDSSPMPGVFG